MTPPKRYSNFPLVEETRKDGWCFGIITEYEDEKGCTDGDAFVEAPDGTRAGLVWDVDANVEQKIIMINRPESKEYWGLYQIYFSKTVYTTKDIVENFHEILPEIQRLYEMIKTNQSLGEFRQDGS